LNNDSIVNIQMATGLEVSNSQISFDMPHVNQSRKEHEGVADYIREHQAEHFKPGASPSNLKSPSIDMHEKELERRVSANSNFFAHSFTADLEIVNAMSSKEAVLEISNLEALQDDFREADKPPIFRSSLSGSLPKFEKQA
jgi:hypothetical protein